MTAQLAPIDVALTVWCEHVKPRATIAARLYDARTGQFYSGQGDIAVEGEWRFLLAALEAVCWAIHDYLARTVLGRGPTIALDPRARPGDGLFSGTVGGDVRPASPRTTGTTARRPLPEQPAPLFVDGDALADDGASGEGACFDRVIPRRVLLLHNEAPAATSAARVRRSR